MDIAGILADWSARPGPLHRRLSQALADGIASGDIPTGAKLPSERALARRLVVSRSTVVAAYRALTSHGLVEQRHGSGTYVAASPRPPLGQTGSNPGLLLHRIVDGVDDGVISLARAVMPVTDRLHAAFEAAIHDLDERATEVGYQPLGVPQLRSAVARAFTVDGLPTAPTEVVVTTGAHQALHVCASILVRPGDWVAVEDPTYPGCIDAFAAAGARLVSLEVDDEGVVPDSVERALSSRTLAAVCISPTFHNPTGALLSDYRRRRIAEIAARHGTPVVEDQVLRYAALREVDVPPPVAAYLPAGHPAVTIGSASKVFWSGLRTGWLRAPEPWLTRLARRKGSADLGSSIIDQLATARLLDQVPDIAASLHARLREHYDAAAALVASSFEDWKWTAPVGGSSLWLDTGVDAERLAQVALRNGVEVIPGPAFSPSGRWASHVRLPFVHPPDIVESAVARLGDAARALSRHEPLPPRQDVAGAVV